MPSVRVRHQTTSTFRILFQPGPRTRPVVGCMIHRDGLHSTLFHRSLASVSSLYPCSTVKRILLAMTLSHQVTQYLFRQLDITAEWTGFDHGRAIVFVTGLTKRGNVHQCSRPDGSGKP